RVTAAWRTWRTRSACPGGAREHGAYSGGILHTRLSGAHPDRGVRAPCAAHTIGGCRRGEGNPSGGGARDLIGTQRFLSFVQAITVKVQLLVRLVSRRLIRGQLRID